MSSEGRRPTQRGQGERPRGGPGGDTVGSGCPDAEALRRVVPPVKPQWQPRAARWQRPQGWRDSRWEGKGRWGRGARAAEVWERAQLQWGAGRTPAGRWAEARRGAAGGPPARPAATPDPEEGPFGPRPSFPLGRRAPPPLCD